MDKTNREILQIIYRFNIDGDISIIEFYKSNDYDWWLNDYLFRTNRLRTNNSENIDLIKEYLNSVGLEVKE